MVGVGTKRLCFGKGSRQRSDKCHLTHLVNSRTRLISKRRVSRIFLHEGCDGAVGEKSESFVTSRRIVLSVRTRLHGGGVDGGALVFLERLDGAVYLISASAEKLSGNESSDLVDVGRAHEGRQHHSGGGVDRKDRGHELVADDCEFFVDDGQTLDVEITAGQNAEGFVVVPGGVGNVVGDLNVGPVFPFDVTVGVVKKNGVEILRFSVGLELGLTVKIGEWLLDFHVHDVKGVVSRVSRGTETVVGETQVFSANDLAVLVEGFNVGKTNGRDVIERSSTRTVDVGSGGVTGQNVWNISIGVVQKTNLTVVLEGQKDKVWDTRESLEAAFLSTKNMIGLNFLTK